MKAVVGVFKSRSDAERSAAELVPLEISKARINILTPEVTEREMPPFPPRLESSLARERLWGRLWAERWA
jgi:hypothetical protein